ncbi:MAG: hypothetical protein EBT08_00360 [Betaproteobacteria bacterium]|nr:hypothetical protein [Betaproteobacteria bacterium]
MKLGAARPILLSLLLAFVNPAWAAWVAYSESDSTVLYYDPASLENREGQLKLWILSNLQWPASDGHTSSLFQLAIDCPGQRMRTLYLSRHSDAMAKGNRLSVTEDTTATNPWMTIPKGTPSEELLRAVCPRPEKRAH